MLKSLSITNYALIHSLEMEPSKSLNMITGETGAGKSIMLGAVGLLLGNRADTKTLFDSDKKCVVEGQFSIENYGLENFFALEELDFEISCIIRREISPSGKSRAFINDTPVKLEKLKELGKALMDIHSQHDNLLLGEGDYQLDLIDAFSQCQSELSEYQSTFKIFQQNKKAYEKLSQSALELNKEADFNKFQLEELSSLKLKQGEQADLESLQEILENAEEIKTKINAVLTAVNDEQFGAIQMLGTANQGLQQLRRYGQKFDSFSERFQSVLIEIKDIAESLEDEDQNIEVDFEKLEAIRERLSKIFHLQKKHGLDSVESLLLLERELADKAFQVDHLEEALTKLKKEMQVSEKLALSKAEALSKKRKLGFKAFGDQLRELLEQLGMENARVEFFAQTIAPAKRGIDQIDILFSSNKGIKPQALKQVASGGEFSRLIFAIKYIMADKMALPTLIFDEIDTGVSGEVALQMVRMMQDIARKHQVICISHLPQVAAKGDQHYFVYKDNSTDKTISRIKLLTPDDRITEIAKMIAGANPSSTAFESAKELLRK